MTGHHFYLTLTTEVISPSMHNGAVPEPDPVRWYEFANFVTGLCFENDCRAILEWLDERSINYIVHHHSLVSKDEEHLLLSIGDDYVIFNTFYLEIPDAAEAAMFRLYHPDLETSLEAILDDSQW